MVAFKPEAFWKLPRGCEECPFWQEIETLLHGWIEYCRLTDQELDEGRKEGTRPDECLLVEVDG